MTWGNSHLRCIILVLGIVLLSGQEALCTTGALSAREYATLRKKLGAIPLAKAKANLADCLGKVTEVRGRVAGVSKGSSGITIIICTREDDSYLIDTDTPPVENPGPALACLVRIGDASTHSLSELKLIAFTYDSELRRLEEAWSRADAARSSVSHTKTASATDNNSTRVRTYSIEELVRAYRQAVKRFNPKLSDSQADTIARSILAFSYRYGVDARLVCAVILAESQFRITATSPAGTMGLGQLMPTTAAGLGVNNAFDPVENIYGSVRYIRSMLDRMSGGKKWNELSWGELALALAAYNAGPGAVKRHGGIPPYRETQNYVRKVISIYKQLCGVKR